MSKWLISGASFMDLDRPTDKISIAQYTALTATGLFFSRYVQGVLLGGGSPSTRSSSWSFLYGFLSLWLYGSRSLWFSGSFSLWLSLYMVLFLWLSLPLSLSLWLSLTLPPLPLTPSLHAPLSPTTTPTFPPSSSPGMRCWSPRSTTCSAVSTSPSSEAPRGTLGGRSRPTT